MRPSRSPSSYRDGIGDGRTLVGTADQVRDRIADWRAAGVEYAIVNAPEQAWDRTTLDAFESEIMPALA